MKVTTEKFNEYIEQFVKGYLIPNAKQPLTKFKLGFAYGTGRIAVDRQMVSSFGVADAEGNVDVELLKNAMHGGLEAAGELPVPMLGIHLQRDEIDKFFKLIETGALS